MREFTALTFNLLSPSHADWPRRRALIRDGLQRLVPDVVALQECAWTIDHDDAAELLGKDYQTIWHSRRSDDGVGAVLGSRHPMVPIRGDRSESHSAGDPAVGGRRPRRGRIPATAGSGPRRASQAHL